MPPPTLEPIQDQDLLAFCTFLHEHLNPGIRPTDWMKAFLQEWGTPRPNNGFMLREDGKIVGGIGAIYSRQIIRGRAELLCNITSWCVLETYRSQSMRLALALTRQPGYHFTNFTPTTVVAGSLKFLKFKPMDDTRTVWPNLPVPFNAGVRIIRDEDDAIARHLSGEAARIFQDHRQFRRLTHLLVGTSGAFCHVVYKRGVLKKLPCAEVIHLSDPDLFLRHHRQLSHFWLTRQGLVTTRVESRFLRGRPPLSREVGGYIPKMYHSDTLDEADISNLYSELVALDL